MDSIIENLRVHGNLISFSSLRNLLMISGLQMIC